MAERFRKKIGNAGRISILTVTYFLLLYSFQIPGMPFATVMPILSMLTIYMIYALFKGKASYGWLKTSKMLCSYLWWNVFLLIYVFGILYFWGSGDGTTPFRDYLSMLVILPIFYISGNAIFNNVEELMKVLYIGVIIQSIIIIVALFSPILTIGLTLLFPEDSYNSDQMGGFEEAVAQGYKIGLGVFTSVGCLRMAVGQIGACYFLMKSQGFKMTIHLLLYLIIALATSIVARTGLLISIVGLIAVYIAKKKQGGRRAMRYAFLVTILVIIGFYVITDVFSANFIEDTFKRFFFTADNGIYGTYFSGYTGSGGGGNSIPPICFETIIGLGITYGTSGTGITTITDGGIMRNYSAMGLIVVTLNYFIISRIFIKQYKLTNSSLTKGMCLFVVLLFMIGEFKEYYIYYIFPISFVFLMFSLMERDRFATCSVLSKHGRCQLS